MGKEDYIITDIDTFKKGGSLCLENAKDHFQCAETIAMNNLFGIASSHLVLAAEEASKAYILLVRSIMGNKEQESFKELFRSHELKQGTSSALSVLMLLFGTLRENIFDWQFEYSKEDLDNDTKLAEFRKRRDNAVNQHMDWLKKQLNEDSMIGRLSAWWKRANNLKNSGFYVDLVNSKWLSPKDISKDKFYESKEHIKYLIDQISIFETLVIEEPEQVKELNKSFLEYLNQV